MESKKIGIIGFGNIGEHIISFINEKYGTGKTVCNFDDRLYEKAVSNSYPLKDFDNNRFADFEFYIGLGYKHPDFKKEIVEQLKKNGFYFPALVHPSSYIDSSVKVGNGTIIYPMCNIGFNVEIGEGSIINNSCVISHDSKIGSCVFLSPSVIISGKAAIGDKTFAGSATVVANNINIGTGVKIGIGSVISKNVDDELTVIGNPAKPVSNLRIN